MSPWQLAKHLAYRLRSRKWEGNSGYELVFQAASVVETAAPIDLTLYAGSLPAVFVRPLDGEHDAQEPRLVTARFEVVVAVAVGGGAYGKESLVGGSRSPTTYGQPSSVGRGVLELEAEVLAAIGTLLGDAGVAIAVRASGAADVQFPQDRAIVSTRSYTLEAVLTTTRYYHPPLYLTAASGVGQATVAWTVGPDRWDRLRVVLRRAAGSTPPATAGAGSAVTLGSALATGVVDGGLAAGTYSYAAFMAYDETGAGAEERYSDQEPSAVATVAVT